MRNNNNNLSLPKQQQNQPLIIWSIQIAWISTKKSQGSSRSSEVSPAWRKPKPTRFAILTNPEAQITINTQFMESIAWANLKFSDAIATLMLWEISSQIDSQACMCHLCHPNKHWGPIKLSSLRKGASCLTCSSDRLPDAHTWSNQKSFQSLSGQVKSIYSANYLCCPASRLKTCWSESSNTFRTSDT